MFEFILKTPVKETSLSVTLNLHKEQQRENKTDGTPEGGEGATFENSSSSAYMPPFELQQAKGAWNEKRNEKSIAP